MNNNQSENKEPDFFTPNAPIKYATAEEKEVIFTCCLFSSLTSLLNQSMLILIQKIHSGLLRYVFVLEENVKVVDSDKMELLLL